jgi:glycosyltransferase involved in cell wall biosynthesis
MSEAARTHRILILAYVFPPFGSVGWSIRAVKFAKYLPALGWHPVVLTIDDAQEYETQQKKGSAELLEDVPQEVKIYRTGSGEPAAALLDKGRDMRRRSLAAGWIVNLLSGLRHFAKSHFLLPDERITWLPFAVRSGRQIVADEKIDVIFATSPPHSSAITGACLKLLTGKPLVLDFRDDWIDTPWHRAKPKLAQWMERRMERWAVGLADRVVNVTEWSRNAFLARYPEMPETKFVLVPNGYDLEDYAGLEQPVSQSSDDRFVIVHAGSLSESEDWRRSPQGFFEAIQHLCESEPGLREKLTLAFTGQLPERFRQMAEGYGLAGAVREMGHLPREGFVALLKSADLLLAINYDGAATLIPGKIYEYWMVGRAPILLLSCPGAAESLVSRHKLGMTMQPYDVQGIEQAVRETYRRKVAGDPLRISTEGIAQYERRALTHVLAKTLVDLSGEQGHRVRAARAAERAAEPVSARDDA